MSQHSLINASGGTHAKIGLIALSVSLAFGMVMAALFVSPPRNTRTDGSIVKAKTTIGVANRNSVIESSH
jgi:hypothetical protein